MKKSRTARKWFCLHVLTRDQFVQFLFSLFSFWHALTQDYRVSERKTCKWFFISPNQPRTEFTKTKSAVYDPEWLLKSESKAGTQACGRWLQKTVYKTKHCSSEKLQRKCDCLENPEGDSPQNQQKNGSSGFIKSEVQVKKIQFCFGLMKLKVLRW